MGINKETSLVLQHHRSQIFPQIAQALKEEKEEMRFIFVFPVLLAAATAANTAADRRCRDIMAGRSGTEEDRRRCRGQGTAAAGRTDVVEEEDRRRCQDLIVGRAMTEEDRRRCRPQTTVVGRSDVVEEEDRRRCQDLIVGRAMTEEDRRRCRQRPQVTGRGTGSTGRWTKLMIMTTIKQIFWS